MAQSGLAGTLSRLAKRSGRLVTEILALPADVLAAELALARVADREREQELRRVLSRVSVDPMGVGRILALLQLIYGET